MTTAPDIPETEDEAIKMGLKKLSESEFAAVKQKYRAEALVTQVDCNKVSVHTKCLVLPCLDGYITVVYCSQNHTCTDAYQTPC